ncbi:MAG: HesA/MoeB/ThiF family protein [Bacteroidia bacterium]|nr:HesA/MoeB/ThiF family protein [Bacteroidia bacterium]
MMLNKDQIERYSRHLLLEGVGTEGQEKLCSSRVLIIGAGGLGCPAGLYLAAAGVGKIGIIDFDRIEISNLQRQVLYRTSDTGLSKALKAGERLSELNPLIRIQVYDRKLDTAAALELFPEYDVIIDGSDNFSTRYLVNDACVLTGRPLIYGSIHRFEGQLSVFNALLPDGTRGPTYRCLFPEPPAQGSIGNCSEVGVLGTLPGMIGTMQASEAIKLITGAGEPLSGKLLLMNSLTMEFTTLHFSRKAHPAISREHFLRTDYDLACGTTEKSGDISELEPEELSRLLENRTELFIVDVREHGELPEDEGLADARWPLSTLEGAGNTVPEDKQVILFCKSGIRSRKAARILGRQSKLSTLYSLRGGILAWLQNNMS